MKDIIESVKVFVRRRPEDTIKCPEPEPEPAAPVPSSSSCPILSISNDLKTCEYYSILTKTKQKFSVNQFFPINILQEEIFQYTAKDIVDSVLKGYSGSILAYGPTGSGKTFTMRGDNSLTNKGVIPRYNILHLCNTHHYTHIL
jgi:hypothetical protein